MGGNFSLLIDTPVSGYQVSILGPWILIIFGSVWTTLRFLFFSSCLPVVHSLTFRRHFTIYSLRLYTNYCTFRFFRWRNSIDTISVQSNSFISYYSCYSLKWSYLNDAVCAVKYKSGSYFRGHLLVTVQYVFSMENNKNIENSIG